MTIDQATRPSSHPWRIALAGVVAAVISTAAAGFLWKEQPFFAGAGAALYVMGGMRAFPWKTPIRKAVSIGTFIGIIVSTALFYWNFL